MGAIGLLLANLAVPTKTRRVTTDVLLNHRPGKPRASAVADFNPCLDCLRVSDQMTFGYRWLDPRACPAIAGYNSGAQDGS